jgi:uncharacterized protein
MEPLDRKDVFNRLFAFYGVLLTERQQQFFKHYYHDDYSLSEIAQIYNVSRNAVHDQIRTCEAHLEEYERKLSLIAQSDKRDALIEKIRETKDLSLLDAFGKLDDQ